MKIVNVEAIPLSVDLGEAQVTSQGAYTKVSICLVKITGEDGTIGVGECLARFGVRAYAQLIDDLLKPTVVGRTVYEIKRIWDAMRSTLNGRSGGILFEAISGVDIALWDLLGKHLKQPVHRILGGYNRDTVPVYASSIMVGEQVHSAADEIDALGFDKVKIKIGASIREEAERINTLRKHLGKDRQIVIDANYIYTEYQALYLAELIKHEDITWFEEPINPENREAYYRLSRRSPIALAAGESEFTAHDCADMISNGTLQYIQPDVTRHGGITETWRTATLADIYDIMIAPHVGFSGIVCVAASLQIAAAASNIYAVECMRTPNAFRQKLSPNPAGLAEHVTRGNVKVPEGPGIGIELDWDQVEMLRDRE